MSFADTHIIHFLKLIIKSLSMKKANEFLTHWLLHIDSNKKVPMGTTTHRHRKIRIQVSPTKSTKTSTFLLLYFL